MSTRAAGNPAAYLEEQRLGIQHHIWASTYYQISSRGMSIPWHCLKNSIATFLALL